MEEIDRLEREWFGEICGGYNNKYEKYVEKTTFGKKIDLETKKIIEEKRKYKIYTNDNAYTIIAIYRSNDKGYLGCQVSTRKFRAGEKFTRGNDLPDGPLNRATWENIKNHIILYELVKLEVNNDQINPDLKNFGFTTKDCNKISHENF